MMVCLCKGVSDKTIRWLVQNGARSLREVMQKCHAGSDCGTCVCEVRSIIERTKAEAEHREVAHNLLDVASNE